MATLTNDEINKLAKQYLLHYFASGWNVDSSILSEWLAENSHTYAGLVDEDESERVLEEFARELDREVRVAIGDYEQAEYRVKAAK